MYWRTSTERLAEAEGTGKGPAAAEETEEEETEEETEEEEEEEEEEVLFMAKAFADSCGVYIRRLERLAEAGGDSSGGQHTGQRLAETRGDSSGGQDSTRDSSI